MRRLMAGMAILTIVALSACWAHADDQQIAQHIVQKLRQQKAAGHLVGFGIDLEVDSGIVWLKGHVGSSQQHKIVLDIARHAPGVEQVVNDLSVKDTARAAAQPKPVAARQPATAERASTPTLAQPSEVAQQDDSGMPNLLRTAADSKLLRKPTLMLSNLNKSVKRALAPPSGEQSASHEIGSSLAKLASVAVHHEEPASPTPAPQRTAAPQRPSAVAKAAAETRSNGPTDAHIAETIIDRLRVQKSQGKLRNFDVDVQVNQGVVWVSGRVASSDQQQLVLDVSRRVPGAKQVVNDLRVSHAVPAKVASVPLSAPAVAAQPTRPQVVAAPVSNPRPVAEETHQAPVSNPAPPRGMAAPAPFAQPQARVAAANARPIPMAYAPARSVQYNNAVAQPQMMGAAPRPIPEVQGSAGVARARYDHPAMPGYAWPSYAAYPNYGAVTYPRQYSPTAWPYIGPFYPYPQVPLGWRKVTLEWDDGWWMLDFKSK
jgi:osmotically-inducible protein OsmY